MDDLYGTGFRSLNRPKPQFCTSYTRSDHFGPRPESNAMNSHIQQDMLLRSQPLHSQNSPHSACPQTDTSIMPSGFNQGISQLGNFPNQLPTQGSRGRISIQPGGSYSISPQDTSTERQEASTHQQRPTPNFLKLPMNAQNFQYGTIEPHRELGESTTGLSRYNDLLPHTPTSTSRLKLQAFNYLPTKPTFTSSSPPPLISSPSQRISIRKSMGRPQMMARSQAMNSFQDQPQDEKPYQVPWDPSSLSTPKRLDTSKELSQPSLQYSFVNPPISRGIQLVSTSQLSDQLQQAFPYLLFNAVQSKCFEAVYKTNDNIVVCAPTGSGKTAILELAICRLVKEFEAGEFKIVYQAPTKSLCAERVRDWQKKFAHLGLNCAELTGDTESSEMRNVGNAAIIVTTPEKWDSVTRKWKDHMKLLQMVKLFLIDEVHILKDARGATLEAVVSRMKTTGVNVRFVALSATVPNSEDIATWLGKDHNNGHIPAHRETFGEDFRPVKLKKYVHGFENKGNNAYSFDKFLDGKIGGLIHRYTAKKPIMVFCFTRKSCENTAAALAGWWAASKVSERAWPAPSQSFTVGNKDIQELIKSGVAFHHAGLTPDDRSAIESAYLNGHISVICCTSTLAVGVNLPCHLVVLKNTVGYQNGGELKEYSDLEVMQMLGRAGRPQFDTSAVAIIMTTNNKAERYQRMVSGKDVLESTLHLNLIEHLNSEIGLGTVKSLYTAKRWLAGTFLAVRIRQNPTYYKLEGVAGNVRDVGERLERVCERDIKLLQDTKLISNDEQFLCTEYGIAMARYMVPFETMRTILNVPEHAKLSQLLQILSQAPEFNTFRLKQNERSVLRSLNNCGLLKFPIKDTVSTTAHKVSLMIQSQLSGAPMPDGKEFNMIRVPFTLEQKSVMERMKRLLMCLIDCKAYDCDAISTRNALELMRSIAAEYWEHSPLQLQQVPNLGPVACRKLIGADISSIEKLMKTSSQDIERIMTKNKPYGQTILNELKNFPQLCLTAELMPRKPLAIKGPVRVNVKAKLSLANAKASFWQRKSTGVTFTAETTSGLLVNFWRGSLRKLEKMVELKFVAELNRPGDKIFCYLACDEIVGTFKEVILEPDIAASTFPKPKTPPIFAVTEKPESRATPDEFGSDDIDDQDIIAVVQKTEISKANETFEDEFMDIDIFDDPSEDREDTRDKQYHSVKLPNGKWQCQHACNNGRTIRQELCKHRCCHDGLDKPPKIRSKCPKVSEGKSNDTSKANKSQNCPKKNSDIENNQRMDEFDNEQSIFNIADLRSPPKYKDMASREYKRFNKLHNEIQGESSKRITPKSNVYTFASKERPDLPSHLQGIQQESWSVDPKFVFLHEDPFADHTDLPSLVELSSQSLAHDNTSELNIPKAVTSTSFEQLSESYGDSIDNFNTEDHWQMMEQPQDLLLSDGFESSVVDYSPSQPATPGDNTYEKIQSPKDEQVQEKTQKIQSNKVQLEKVSIGMKRSADESLDSSSATKTRRVIKTTMFGDIIEEEKTDSDDFKAKPEWVKNIDPNVLKFFEGLVEYV